MNNHIQLDRPNLEVRQYKDAEYYPYLDDIGQPNQFGFLKPTFISLYTSRGDGDYDLILGVKTDAQETICEAVLSTVSTMAECYYNESLLVSLSDAEDFPADVFCPHYGHGQPCPND